MTARRPLVERAGRMRAATASGRPFRPGPTMGATPGHRPPRRHRTLLAATGVAAAAYWALIFTLTHIPARGLPRVDHLDKLVHLTIYFGLAVLATVLAAGWRGRVLAALPWVIPALILNAIVDEASQALIPTREPSVLDFLADVVGIGLGVPVGAGLFQLRRRWLAARSDPRQVAGPEPSPPE